MLALSSFLTIREIVSDFITAPLSALISPLQVGVGLGGSIWHHHVITKKTTIPTEPGD